MNKLGTKKLFNKFSGKDYLVLTIDEEPIDLILHQKYPDDNYKGGLVPTLLYWLSDETEKKIVWERILPDENEVQNAPILMCSEDIDLYCTVIIAEVTQKEEMVIWNRIGLDIGDGEGMPESIGSEVKWFPNISYKFDLNNYKSTISQFKQQEQK